MRLDDKVAIVTGGASELGKVFVDGPAEPVNGALAPDLLRPGIGLEFRCGDAALYEV